jgi:hypothetical protein
VTGVQGDSANLDELDPREVPVLASLDLGRWAGSAALRQRPPAKRRNLPIGRPRKLSDTQLALAELMRAGGEPVPTIAHTLRVGTPTM